MDFCVIVTFLYFVSVIGECFSSCSRDLPHGKISRGCDTSDSMCTYSCDDGYEKDQFVTYYVICSSSGEWVSSWDEFGGKLCKPKSCSNEIPNGFLSGFCNSKVGSACEYFCYTGYQKTISVSTVTCQTSTHWSIDPHSLCTNNQQCAYKVAYGDLDLSCRRLPGETCSYTCHEGHLPSTALPLMMITCESSLTWSQPLTSLCESRLLTTATTAAPKLCPGTIPHGSISSYCDRTLFSECHYRCDWPCEKIYIQLYCEYDGDWSNKSSACRCEARRVTPAITTKGPIRCPSTILNGNIYYDCNRLPYSRCGYTCDSGCESIYIKLQCRNGYWVSGNSACRCQGLGNTTTTEYGDTTNTERIVGITLSVIGMFVLLTGCVAFCCYRQHQARSNSQPVRYQDPSITGTVPNRRSPSAPPNYMVPNQENFGTSLQQPTNTEQSPFMQLQPPTDANIHSHELTEYTGITKSEPSDDPPSYDQVISHPSQFKV